MNWLTSFIKQFFRVRKYNEKHIIQTHHINPWHEVPFIRLLIPFALGIVATTENIYLVHAALLLSFAVLVLLVFYIKTAPRSIYIILISNLTFFLLGMSLPQINKEGSAFNHFSNYTTDSTFLKVLLVEDPIEREKSFRVKTHVMEVLQNNSKQESEGNLLLYLPKNTETKKLEHGHVLIIKGTPQEIPKPLNPGEFDYQRYMMLNGFQYQLFIHDKDWKLYDKNHEDMLTDIFYWIKKQITNIYHTYIPGEEQKGVAAALIFGYRDDLSQDLVEAYADTGTLHVLAVSGLHVGILYFVLKALLGFLTTRKTLRMVRFLIIIFMLWFYALITGLSPSVNRAALMFTIILISETFKRNTNIYNSIAASAFLLLLFDPNDLYDVGFQLSYLAVLGIVFLHPRIYSWFSFKTWLMNQIWNITSVSIAAQLATSPLGFFYFGQFPNYFLISNLLIIPLSTSVTYLGLLLVLGASLPFLAELLGNILNELIRLTNDVVIYIGKIPYATFEGVSLNVGQTFLLCAIFLWVCQFLSYKKASYFYAASLFILVFMGLKTWQHIQWQAQEKIYIYAIGGKTAISFMDGNQCTLLADGSLTQNPVTLKFKFQKHWNDEGIQHKRIYNFREHLPNNGSVLHHHNLHIFNQTKLIIADQIPSSVLSDSVDIVIIKNKPCKHLSEITQKIKAKRYIADLSNPPYLIERWKQEAQLNGDHFEDCRNGALCVDVSQ